MKLKILGKCDESSVMPSLKNLQLLRGGDKRHPGKVELLMLKMRMIIVGPERGVEMCGGDCGGGEREGEVVPEIGGGEVGRELGVSEENNCNLCFEIKSLTIVVLTSLSTCH